MNIASLMVLVKPCDCLPLTVKLSNVMLCPLVCKCLKLGEGERALRDAPCIFPQNFCLFPHVFHVATRLITSVPVHYLPFMDYVVFVL